MGKASVVAAFSKTVSRSVRVRGVERIQNMSMWQSYAVKRQTILMREKQGARVGALDRDPEASRFERIWLFHGTNAEVVDKIVQQGFNRSFCGKNATAYGKGVYFARDSAYSSSKTYSVPDQNG